ncbi:haloacid dehalogenase type II [Pseudomonas sp. 10B1]|uniref:haloacid dehalogenase type II n=1 Tax=unclassified Pseudomonas TaxID=196821 RepID=UPI002AB41A89|nr:MULTISPECIES: haloacid dehalogenase type II [unclassified Pseudomonas]MDY7560669.1 haloacid dehalogenase type II [Pseudomonas sp. AB6]MEA9976898.1 haloacid dehalogenase type II [Pseudomonas sp. RTS4]MEA9993425.1 haloacid dehalogenase type II [Pseudomonas sp. AA4]MEB0089046.1 haloacid dehalogenase type II [Pseudomonas sp. RTI1]MEB0124088.1 haloacid dehalogenase type II [Pseudomonas sp. CCC1.2]
MVKAIAFDIYGTLIDTQGVLGQLTQLIGEKALIVAKTWRQKQLEYSFRRGLMRDYCDFSICTRQALIFACREQSIELDSVSIQLLMDTYSELEAFADVSGALEEMVNSGLHLYAFSNGSQQAVERLLQHAHVREFFTGIVSVESVRSFKPAPEVYDHLIGICKLPAAEVCLVSSNPFDVLGAMHSGLKCAWVNRDPAVQFDPWGVEPHLILDGLTNAGHKLQNIK